MKWKKRRAQVGRRFTHVRHINSCARHTFPRIGMDEGCAADIHGHGLEWEPGADFYTSNSISNWYVDIPDSKII